MRRLRIGIIGCGGIANGKHMPALKAINKADMVAFCDLIKEKAETAAKAYGSEDAQVYDTYQDMLKDTSIDMIYVQTPNRSHASNTCAPMAADNHVACEQPSAHTAPHSRSLA